MQQAKKPYKRGGPKIAPEGYYTASEATRRLGLNRNAFQYYVRRGKIHKYVPPLRTEGFYDKKEIDQLATEFALFFHASTATQHTPPTQVRVATPADAPGIVAVLADMGWPHATVEQRLAWYRVNPYIDYVVLSGTLIAGYITSVPYTPSTMEAMMSRHKRAWDILPDDILSYAYAESVRAVYPPFPPYPFDVYVGASVRQELPNHTLLGFRLIAGFISFLEELAQQGIRIRRMYAVSAEDDGKHLSDALGFVEQPAQEGDLFPDGKEWKRYMLDLETSDSRFAQQYRESIKERK